MDFTTLARVKTYMETGGFTADANDPLIPGIIAGVSRRMAERMDRGVNITERTEDFDSHPSDHAIILHAFPVTACEVRHDTQRGFAASTIVDPARYHLRSDRGVVVWDRYSPTYGKGSMRVVYTGGMAADTTAFIAAYPDLALACEMQVAYVLQRRQTPGGTATVAGAGSRTYVGQYTLLDDVAKACDGYKRRVV